jgi:hypothetical protein
VSEVHRWPQVPGGTVVVAARDYDALADHAKSMEGDRDGHLAISMRRACRIRELEAALREIVANGDYTAPEGMKAVARSALKEL